MKTEKNFLILRSTFILEFFLAFFSQAEQRINPDTQQVRKQQVSHHRGQSFQELHLQKFSIQEQLLIPESFLHDEVPPEALSPQTDIFLEQKMAIDPEIRKKYSFVDPRHLIAERPLELALNYYDQLKQRLKKDRYLGIINFQIHSHEPRLFLIDMTTGDVEQYLVAHGAGSDPADRGYAKYFSNKVDSHMSSLGAFITAETYVGKSGYSLRLDGIESSNSKMRERAVVFHGSRYANLRYNPIGLSWGCPAVSHSLSQAFINKIKNGVLFFSWFDQ